MKRLLMLFLACFLLTALACAAKQDAAPQPAPAVTVPQETEVKLTLPLGTRDGVARTLSAYTAGFAAENGDSLTFSVVSGDTGVAEGVLKDDGTLYVIARGTGETKLTVTAKTASGKEGAATVSVTVRDARRMLVLILLGVLSVTLLVLLGKPSAPKKPDAAKEPEPNENPERSQQ